MADRDPFLTEFDSLSFRIRQEFAIAGTWTMARRPLSEAIRHDQEQAERMLPYYEPFSRPWRACLRRAVFGHFSAWWADVMRKTYLASSPTATRSLARVTGIVS